MIGPRLHHGLTTLEVLCATALAAMLMTAVLGVVSGLAQRERVLNARETTPAWARQLGELLQRDTLLAERVERTPQGFTLTGPLGRDPRTGAATWREAEVVYRVVPVPSNDSSVGQALTRSVREGPTLTAVEQTEVVCFGVQQLWVTSGEETDGELTDEWVVSPDAAENPPVIVEVENVPVPRRLRVRLWRIGAPESTQKPVLDCVLHRP